MIAYGNEVREADFARENARRAAAQALEAALLDAAFAELEFTARFEAEMYEELAEAFDAADGVPVTEAWFDAEQGAFQRLTAERQAREAERLAAEEDAEREQDYRIMVCDITYAIQRNDAEIGFYQRVLPPPPADAPMMAGAADKGDENQFVPAAGAPAGGGNESNKPGITLTFPAPSRSLPKARTIGEFFQSKGLNISNISREILEAPLEKATDLVRSGSLELFGRQAEFDTNLQNNLYRGLDAFGVLPSKSPAPQLYPGDPRYNFFRGVERPSGYTLKKGTMPFFLSPNGKAEYELIMGLGVDVPTDNMVVPDLGNMEFNNVTGGTVITW